MDQIGVLEVNVASNSLMFCLEALHLVLGVPAANGSKWADRFVWLCTPNAAVKQCLRAIYHSDVRITPNDMPNLLVVLFSPYMPAPINLSSQGQNFQPPLFYIKYTESPFHCEMKCIHFIHSEMHILKGGPTSVVMSGQRTETEGEIEFALLLPISGMCCLFS